MPDATFIKNKTGQRSNGRSLMQQNEINLKNDYNFDKFF